MSDIADNYTPKLQPGIGPQPIEKADTKMKFEYYGGPQRTPEWFEVKRGRIGASSLWRWLATSKAKNSLGKPLKERLDYEKELMFERQFNTTFEMYTNSAMQDGVDYEDFGRKEYERVTGNSCLEAGCFYSDVFAASPDRFVVTNHPTAEQPEGLMEIKILKDNSFLEVLESTKALKENDQLTLNKTTTVHKHWKQMQGQMWASGRPWCDYVAVNFNTKKVAIVRVHADQEFHDYLELAVLEELVTTEFDQTLIHDIKGEIPSGLDVSLPSGTYSKITNAGGWSE